MLLSSTVGSNYLLQLLILSHISLIKTEAERESWHKTDARSPWHLFHAYPSLSSKVWEGFLVVVNILAGFLSKHRSMEFHEQANGAGGICLCKIRLMHSQMKIIQMILVVKLKLTFNKMTTLPSISNGERKFLLTRLLETSITDIILNQKNITSPLWLSHSSMYSLTA